jgi:hypothetical protein
MFVRRTDRGTTTRTGVHPDCLAEADGAAGQHASLRAAKRNRGTGHGSTEFECFSRHSVAECIEQRDSGSLGVPVSIADELGRSGDRR